MNMTKPGYLTTEFWATLIVDVGAMVALVHPGFDIGKWVQPLAFIAASVATAVYSHARASVKTAAVAATAPAIAAAAAAVGAPSA